MTTTPTMCVNDGGLINPDAFPARASDLDTGAITGSATSIRAMATTVHDETSSIDTTWAGLSGSYEAPEQEQVYALMTPAVTSATELKTAFDAAAGHLDTYAGVLDGIKSRLSTFETTAADFRAEVINGVETIAAESNEANVEDYAEWAFQWVPGVEQRTVTVPWYEDSATVERNQKLLEEYAGLLEEISTAATQCANDINALVQNSCVAPVEAIPAEAFNNPEMPMPWGESRDEDRNCPESVGHGAANFGIGIAEGAGMLVLGYNPENGEFFQGEAWGQAWGGLGNLAGSLVLATTPAATIANIMAATGNGNAFTDFMYDRQKVVAGTVGSMIGFDIENPDDPWHKWKEDGIATGVESVLNVGTFFIPGAGQVGAGLKVGSASAKVAKIAAVGADFLIPGGSWVVKGGVRVATGLSDLLKVADNGVPGLGATTQVGVNGVKLSPTALINAIDDVPVSQATPPPSSSIVPSGDGAGVNPPASVLPDVSGPTNGPGPSLDDVAPGGRGPEAPAPADPAPAAPGPQDGTSPSGPRPETAPEPTPGSETGPRPEPTPVPEDGPSPAPAPEAGPAPEPAPAPEGTPDGGPSPTPVPETGSAPEAGPAPEHGAEPSPSPEPAPEAGPSPETTEPGGAPTHPAPEAPAPAPEAGPSPETPAPETPRPEPTPGGQPYDPEAPVRDTSDQSQAPGRPTQADVDEALRNAPVDEHGRPVDHRDGEPLRGDNANGSRGWHMKWDPDGQQWIAENPGNPTTPSGVPESALGPQAGDTGLGTVESPRVYHYDHPAAQFADAPQPDALDLVEITPGEKYPVGTVEHMHSRWSEYLASHTDDAMSWDSWRDMYVRNLGHLPRGTAFEQAYFDVRDLDATEWSRNTTIDTAFEGSGIDIDIDRNYDGLNPSETLALEMKSGSTIDPAQLAKDKRLVAEYGWDVHYVFGSQPSPSTIQQLADAGVTYEVFHSVPVARP